MIPKTIYVTHKSLNFVKKDEVLTKCMMSWKKHTNYEYKFYDNKACDNFIREHFDDKVYEAYKRVPLDVMRADLWRYCILYIYGGVYADADAECIGDPDIFTCDDTQFVVGSEPYCLDLMCQWTFSAPANSPVLKHIIDVVVYRMLNSTFEGPHFVHHITGPNAFTDGIYEFFINNKLPVPACVNNDLTTCNKTIKIIRRTYFHNQLIHHYYKGSKGWKKNVQSFITNKAR